MLFIRLLFICFTAYMQLVTPSEVAMADVPPDLHAWKKIYLALRENKFSLKKNTARRYGPLGVPADLQSADKKGSTTLKRICNPQP